VDTSTLKVDSTNNRVGIVQASPAYPLDVTGIIHSTQDVYALGGRLALYRSAGASYFDWSTSQDLVWRQVTSVGGAGASTLMTLNSTGLGVGASPTNGKLIVGADATTDGNGSWNTTFRNTVGAATTAPKTGLAFSGYWNGTSNFANFAGISGGKENTTDANTAGMLTLWTSPNGGSPTTRLTIDSSGNVGIGVTPSAWATYKAVSVGGIGASVFGLGSSQAGVAQGAFFNNGAGSGWAYSATSQVPTYYLQINGENIWNIAASGTAGAQITAWTPAMKLDASGNLLVGTTTGSRHCIYKSVAVGSIILDIQSPTTSTISALVYAADGTGASGANTVIAVQKVTATNRSINAGGTINASGADYAEYMTKASDFVLNKGDVAGIDANGKLTNVFADAVSFVVKSTDPSYVGNDKWGVDLEGDALEAARQLVDRIAFAGQVPVNVTGAKAGDYIIPVVDGTGIKGISVSNPTFDQYQLAVGKVIAIDTDGRARIIVKVA
jgi:hypothetical protein